MAKMYTPPTRQNTQRKILLVTIYGNNNYGNILQRCALSRVIESFGFEVWHLCVDYTPSLPSGFSVKRFIKQIVKHILALLGVSKYREPMRWKALQEVITKSFSKFQDKYITRRKYTTFQQTLTAASSTWADYDYAVTGSDIVWNNWTKIPHELEYFYLSFMPREKRVCYAPSFGFSAFPDEDYETHKNGLAGFERLSCREQEMIPMIKQACGKDAQLVLDPTLLLTAEEWRSYAEKPSRNVPEKYVLCYFLGSKPPEFLQAIRKVAGGLPVITLYDLDAKAYLSTDPGGFLWLIDHADFVCTDSFHGTAFSVNFGKNFLAFRRRDVHLFGRISGLLDTLNIAGHVYGEGAKSRPDPVNYNDVHARLDALRKSSLDFLKECLHID